MTEKVTTMILKVDLQCSSCYKKIKKLLCKFPQIRDQVYDEKKNTVTITVICCNPEKIRDKLSCKGEKIIKSIEIKDPPKPKPDTEKEKPKEKPKPEPVCPATGYPIGICCGPCAGGFSGGPCYHGFGRPLPPPRCSPPRRPCYCSGSSCQTTICVCYTEGNPSACRVM